MSTIKAEKAALPRDSVDVLTDMWAQQGRSALTSEGVHRVLREAVLSQALAPGSRLGEEELAAVFGVSRTPVREALLRLEAEGLSERYSGRTAIVTALSPQEIIEIYDVRAVIDGLAARLTASLATPPVLASLQWINDQMRQAGERGEFSRMADLNLEFHAEIAKASGNSFLVHLLTAVHDRVRRFPGTTFATGGRWKTALAEHAAILEAIAKGAPELSERRAREHMVSSRETRVAMHEAD